jgi:hypothetical protein
VWFWTKGRVRVWLVFVVLLSVAELVLTLLVLGGAIGDSIPVRVVVLAGLALILVSLATRALADVMEATRE